jgi:hypothetical protein
MAGAQLTPGAIARLVAGETGQAVTLQCLGIKKLQNTQAQQDRYRVLLSDGEYSHSCMLATQLAELVHTGQLKDNSIVLLNDYICNQMANKKIVISRFRGTQGTAVVGLFGMTAASTGASERTLKRVGTPYEKIYVHAANHAGYYPGAAPISLKLLFSPADGHVLGCQATGAVEGVEKRVDVIATIMQASTYEVLLELALFIVIFVGSERRAWEKRVDVVAISLQQAFGLRSSFTSAQEAGR